MSNPSEPPLSNRELATVLAALRRWQADETSAAGDDTHFAHCDPLSTDEIDELCERLNFGPDSMAHKRPRLFKVEVRKTEVNRYRAFLDITARTPMEASATAEVLLAEDDESIPWTEIGTTKRGVRVEIALEAN